MGKNGRTSEEWLEFMAEAAKERWRRQPNNALFWTIAHRRLRGRPMRLIPAMDEIYLDTHEVVVIQKSAQVFVTEYMINAALFVADVGLGGRGNSLYLMPTQSMANDLGQARIEPAIRESPYLSERARLDPPNRSKPARMNLKKVGNGYLYLRGSDSRRQISQVDADAVFLDEFDEMEEGTLELAQRRLASSKSRWLRVASTPSLPETGINRLFLESDQRHYFIPCPSCELEQELKWEENVDRDRCLVVCQKCRSPMDLWLPGRWVPQKTGNLIHGYYLNRLYSPLADLKNMIERSEGTTPAEQAEFRRLDMGQVYVPEGGQLTIADIDACREDYQMPRRKSEWTVMGVDVGLVLHVVVREREGDRWHLVFAGGARWEDLDELIDRFNVTGCVIDDSPEYTKAREFQQRALRLHPRCHVYLARYIDTGDHHTERSHPAGEQLKRTFKLNRTAILEETLAAFQNRQMTLPQDARGLGGSVKKGQGEYYRHMTALVRLLEQDATGNWVSRYDNRGKADHYAHAEAYCRAAARIRRERMKFVG